MARKRSRRDIPDYWFKLPARGAEQACVRCGRIRKTNQSRSRPLCRDCTDVTTDLGETETWTENVA